MIRRFILTLMAAALLLPQLSFGQELKVMSYNIRLNTEKDGTNAWMYRCPATIEMIKDQAPDVFGVQELFLNRFVFLRSLLMVTMASVSAGMMERRRASTCPSSGTRRP